MCSVLQSVCPDPSQCSPPSILRRSHHAGVCLLPISVGIAACQRGSFVFLDCTLQIRRPFGWEMDCLAVAGEDLGLRNFHFLIFEISLLTREVHAAEKVLKAGIAAQGIEPGINLAEEQVAVVLLKGLLQLLQGPLAITQAGIEMSIYRR